MWLSEALPQKSGHAGAKDAGKIPGRKKNGASEKFCPQMLRPENPGKKTAILWPEKQEKKAEEARAKTLREAGSGEENICETPHRKKESIPKERSDLSVCSLLLLHDDWMIYDCDKPIEADADNRFFFLRKIIFRREKLNFFSSFAVMFLCSVPAKRPEARCDLN